MDRTQPNDILICIYLGEIAYREMAHHDLTIGKQYICKGIYGDSFYLKGDNGVNLWYKKFCFAALDEYRSNKLNQIFNDNCLY